MDNSSKINQQAKHGVGRKTWVFLDYWPPTNGGVIHSWDYTTYNNSCELRANGTIHFEEN